MKALLKSVYKKLPLKRFLFEILRRCAKLPLSTYQHLHFHGPFRVDMGAGRSFRMISYGETISNELFWAGYGKGFEAYSLRIWERLAERSNGAILDIGANAGIYSLAARTVNSRVQIIAFEPVERIVNWMQENIALNDYEIEIVQKAVSDKSAAVPIYDSSGAVEYDASLEYGHGELNTISYNVEAIRLDDFMQARGIPAVGLMKVDVERHEPAVLRGALQTLRRDMPPIIIEILDEEPDPFMTMTVLELGYRIFNVSETKGLVPCDRLRRLGAVEDKNFNNLLCTERAFEAAGLSKLLAH